MINSWKKIFVNEFSKDYFKKLMQFLIFEYQNYEVYPKRKNIFNAFKLTSFEDVKVVIVGQDPYHHPQQAHGLCFSVPDGVKIPPSLRNIYLELSNDLNIEVPKSGNLTKWAQQGVLLINTVLTVRRGCPHSHRHKGWEIFTDEVIKALNTKNTPIIYFLWGNDAKTKRKLITNSNHYILTAAHPSPLSAYQGFFGCNHFSKANAILRRHNLKEIDWKI